MHKDQKEWSFDLANLDAKTIKALKKAGLGGLIKNKDDDRGDFIHLRRRAKKKDGEDAKPISIVDHRNNKWDDRLIGNGSTLNVFVAINENGGHGRKSLSPLSIQVWDHVEYQPKSAFPTREDNETDQSAQAAEDDDQEDSW